MFLLGIILAIAGLAITQELTTTYDALATRLPVSKDAIRTKNLDRMRAVTGYLLSNVGALVGGVTSMIITGLLVTIFLYFLLRHGEDRIGRLTVLIPLDPHK